MSQFENSALIMVDLQNDFCPGGSLAVPEGDVIISLANRLQAYFDLVIATQDWHPPDHTSFATNHVDHQPGEVIMVNGIMQILWPVHCVQGTKGAALHPDLDLQRVQKFIYKGVDKDIDSYSAFFDNAHLRSTGLSDYLQERQIKKIAILGLATDYCVKYSSLDAVHLGFEVMVIQDACRGVALHPNDIDESYAQMRQAGVTLINSSEILVRE